MTGRLIHMLHFRVCPLGITGICTGYLIASASSESSVERIDMHILARAFANRIQKVWIEMKAQTKLLEP